MAKLITKLKGTNGIIYIYEDRIVISRKTFFGFSTFGIVGDKTLFYNAIQEIEYNGAGGWLRVHPKGILLKNYNAITEVLKATKDDYTISIPFWKVKQGKEIHEIIAKKVNEANRTSNTNISPTNEIREYKKLLDDGIITEEEFEKKKQELLMNK